MAQSNPIYSHDLYSPGQENTLQKLAEELQEIQELITKINAAAKTLRDSLKILNTANNPQKVVSAATEAQRIHNEKQRIAVKQQLTLEKMRQAAAAQTAAIVTRSEQQQQREYLKTQKEMKRLEIEAIRLEKAKKSLAAQSTRTRSSFSGLLGSIRSLTYAYFSLSAAQQIVGKFFSETKALNTLDIALKQTLGSIQSVTEEKQFLLDITERYGADLLTTSNAYLKFGTAAKQAGVSAQDTRNIFESVTKASSVLGLGAERTSYVFLALEQIMSKGRLSTEELRRQLGEHLPGAFGIAAKAMKFTTAELTDMLKKGEIASTDFVPKFAKEFEKAYGIENLKRVDNLAAAQGRFNNEITLLIRELDVAGFFKDFFDSLASGVKFVRENVDAFLKLGKALIYVGTAWAAFKIGEAITSMRLLTGATVALTNALKANPLGVVAAAAIALYGAIDILTEKLKESGGEVDVFAQRQREIANEVAEANKTINAQGKALKDGNIPASERKKIIDQLNTSLAPYLDKLLTEKSSYEEIKKAIDLANQSLATRVSLLQLEDEYKGKREEEAKINEELASIAIEVAKAEADLEETKRRLQNTDVSGNKVPFGFDDKAVNAGNKLNALTQKYNSLIERQGTLQNRLVDIQEEYRRLNKGKGIPVIDEITNPDDPTGPSKKDPRLVEIERLKYLNSLRREGMAKDLEALALNLAEKRILYEKDAEVLAKLEEYKWQQIQAIREKYVSIEADRQEQDTKDLIEGLNTVAESVAKAFAARASGNLGQTAEQKQAEFDLQQAHEKRLFELHEENADKREKFDIQQEIDLINFKLKLNEQYGGLLNEKEIQRLNELRDALQIELGKPIKADKKEVDIFSLLGIDFGGDNDKLDAFKSTIKIVGDELSSFVDLQKELVDQQIEDADRLVRSKEEALNRQIALAAANQANNVAGAQAELALAKKTQEEALKQRKKVQKQELALDTLAQSSNIITAITAALKLGPILGPIAVGAILATFAASKIKALALINKKTFRKGGYREIGGGTHESGNDTHVGGNNWAEKDESVGIFNKNATKKYKPTLKAFVNAANKGTLDKILFQDRRAIQGITNNYGPRVDTSVMEKRLGRLVSLTEKKSYVDGSGNLVINDRGRTTIVRNGSK